MKNCYICELRKSSIKRPKTGKSICKECFCESFEDEINYAIVSNNLFNPKEKVCIGASGGKDSTVLAYVLNLLNKKYKYDLDLFLLSIDEGIKGYRDDSLETVKQNQKDYDIPLKILSYKDLYGWTMDDIVKTVGLSSNCTFCGVFRRQALYRGAELLKADKIVTGHNADDLAETVLMNLLRGDYHRLVKCVDMKIGFPGEIQRIKPFKYTYEKEIVLYAYHKKLIYHSTECIYSPNAYRGHLRELIKNLEMTRPSAIIDIIHSAEKYTLDNHIKVKVQTKTNCKNCGFISSNTICKACELLEKLKSLKNNKILIKYEEKSQDINYIEIDEKTTKVKKD